MNKRYGMAALLLMPMLGQAEPSLELDYGTFYSQMKTFAKGEFGHARLGFYLASQQNGRRCGLTSARVSTPDRDVPAEVTVDGELRLPYDDDLNLDKAIVVVGLTEAHAACDLSVQVMADAPATPEVPLAELVSRQQQMQRLLDKMAGMVGQYFLPKMEGVRISMVAPAGTAYLVEGARQEAVSWQQGQLLLSNAQLKGFAQGKLQLQGEILRLTPWLHKG
ncbi:DUF2987 domain-containing protein [Aeromonas caviae]|jgi:hypothetical protein|uniref:DUF2987 domain-containing protein n=1 Tax=Aeromonas TaxID=642 RepID=UPI00191E7FBB|nr:DUF2987 domain-containing protein [Aeromonas caviae]MBP8268003.1 DUF2987 domain-containing protein [Aeromonas sp.]MBL0547732.1 DUF2987 domain-containing protein [Aeromonas caviae]MDK3164537.1 DUF2987 domain-containing protein [Aeromonas caviae]MDX7783189.1 DUF2987 domain-containing protein [Aeromonas caviae]MDX7892007.1 DUF2987 domain-containing protein [Aeromonas caviae]